MMRPKEGFNMTSDATSPADDRAELPPAAKRALAEAEARRRAIDEKAARASDDKEAGGPRGKEPTRYGDWEMKGRAIDF